LGQSDAGPLNPRRPGAEQTERLAALLHAVEGAERALVLTHDNPDPDAIASAAGLAFVLQKCANLQVSLTFGGIVGRAENRVLIEELGVRFERVEKVTPASYPVVALVDTQPRAGNNSLPAGQLVTVVLDHHPARPELTAVLFADVRPGVGSCCSMVVEYLRAAKLEPDRRLATALFYAIQSETLDLGREASEADVSASLYLYPRSDPAAISRIRHPRIPEGFFRAVHAALERAWRAGRVMCVPVGRLDYPDMVAQLADLFMRADGVEWVIAAGHFGDDLLLSLRTLLPNARAGEVVRAVVNGRGPAGGHDSMAGARIDVRLLTDAEIETLTASLFADLCVALGEDSNERRALVVDAGNPPEGHLPEGEDG